MELVKSQTPKSVLFLSLASEGMGHATRARTLIKHLAPLYDLHVFCGGSVYQFLKDFHPHVHKIPYVRLSYRRNRLDVLATIRSELPKLFAGFRQIYRFVQMTRHMNPVALISDFECLSSWSAIFSGVKVISFDNMHLHPYAALDTPAPEDKGAAQMVKRICRINVPIKHKVLISCFFTPPLKENVNVEQVRYVPCSVREEVLTRQNKVHAQGPVLVYQTSQSNDDLHTTLKEAVHMTMLNFVVYGSSGTGAMADGRIQYRDFDENKFLDDMAAAPFVMINGGHSAICEALSLGKPILAEPIQAQYEQILNGQYLAKLGVGIGVRKLTAQDIAHFSERVPLMRQRALHLNVVDNESMIQEVRRAIEELSPTGLLKNPIPKRSALLAPTRLRLFTGPAQK